MHPTLEILANRYRLAVITNGNADVRRLGLADYFQFALCAEELGVGKPDPHPFEEALKRAGVAAERAVHIGDHPSDDIHGARNAGMRAIWFNPQGKPWEGETDPDAEIRSLAELPALLGRWNTRAEYPAPMKSPLNAGFFMGRRTSDGTAAVLAVGLLRRVGDHVGLDLLHLAATRQEFLHGPCERIALLLLGFDARQFLDLYRRLLALAGRRGDSLSLSLSPSSLSSAAASSSPSSSSDASSSSCSRSSSLMFYLLSCQSRLVIAQPRQRANATGKIRSPRH